MVVGDSKVADVLEVLEITDSDGDVGIREGSESSVGAGKDIIIESGALRLASVVGKITGGDSGVATVQGESAGKVNK